MLTSSIMELALAQAEKALTEGEVPVGCAVLKDGLCIAQAHNLTNALSDPLAHAELLCVRELYGELCGGSPPVGDAVFYVTIEPCAMCAGVLERIGVRVVFGHYNEIFGCKKILGREIGECLEDRRGVEIFKRFYCTPHDK